MVDVLNVRSTAANPKLFFLPNRATALRSQLTGRMTLHLNSKFHFQQFFFVKSIHIVSATVAERWRMMQY